MSRSTTVVVPTLPPTVAVPTMPGVVASVEDQVRDLFDALSADGLAPGGGGSPMTTEHDQRWAVATVITGENIA